MKSVLLLFAIVGLCLCVAQAATPVPTSGAPRALGASSPVVSQTTLPTVAGLSADTSSTIVSKAATQVPRATTLPTVRETTARQSATALSTAVPSTKAITPRATATPTIVASTSSTATPEPTTGAPTTDPNPTEPGTLYPLNATLPTPWPNATAYEPFNPTEDRTPDIDPGMTPYTGPTEIGTLEPTPTWEVLANVSNATPTEPPMAIPYFTADVAESPSFELPPGAYGVEEFPTPSETETVAPLPTPWPEDAAGSSFLPRWLGYLLFIFLGISGVAGLALVGSYLGSGSPAETGRRLDPLSSPPRAREVRLLQLGEGDTTAEQQALVDLIAGFAPQSMHVERLGRHLLRLEHGAQMVAQDRSIRLGRLVNFSAIPSVPVPASASAWARVHGFRVLAVDGSGMALVMPALSNGGRSILGVLPVGEMVEGASPSPMPVLFPGSEGTGAFHHAVFRGMESPLAGNAANET